MNNLFLYQDLGEISLKSESCTRQERLSLFADKGSLVDKKITLSMARDSCCIYERKPIHPIVVAKFLAIF